MQMNKVANGRHAVRAESQDSVTIPGDAGLVLGHIAIIGFIFTMMKSRHAGPWGTSSARRMAARKRATPSIVTRTARRRSCPSRQQIPAREQGPQRLQLKLVLCLRSGCLFRNHSRNCVIEV